MSGLAGQPKRIQRRRTKGWRMPEGAVYVGRPSGWGNPYPVVEVPDGGWTIGVGDGKTLHPDRWPTKAEAAQAAVDAYRRGFTIGAWSALLAEDELAGRDLACWCPLDQPCHADVLLELANRADS